MPGLVFDKYEVLERLAVGGMGEVLLARQVSGVAGFERFVILKTLLSELANDPAFVDQFVDEARVVATLSHPNVVSVFEVGVWDGSYYLAMEYIPGPTLSQLRTAAAKAGREVPLALCAQIGLEAALGLDHAHGAKDLRGGRLGVVHRDVSPQNIMVRVDGVTKVVDFGIARASNRASRTATGMVKGKIAYMAPEQLSSRDLDGRVDQFSLGVTLWELCTGKYLFPRGAETEMIRAVLTKPIPRPSEVVPDFPAPLEDVLMRMLERVPDRRFPRCYDVAQQLAAWLKESHEPHDHETLAAFIEAIGAQPERKTTPAPSNFVVAFKSSNPVSSLEARPSAPPAVTRGARPSAPPATTATPDPVDAATTDKVVPAVLPSRATRWVAVGLASAGALAAGWLLAPYLLSAEVERRVTGGETPAVDAGGVDVRVAELPVDAGSDDAAATELAVTALPIAEEIDAGPGPSRSHPKRDVRVVEVRLPPAGEGQLVVRTSPWTLVSVDGAILGSTPLLKRLPAGPHTVLMENKEAGITETRQVVVAVGATLKLDLDLKK